MKYSQLMLVLRRSHYCLTMLQAYYRGFHFPVRVVCWLRSDEARSSTPLVQATCMPSAALTHGSVLWHPGMQCNAGQSAGPWLHASQKASSSDSNVFNSSIHQTHAARAVDSSSAVSYSRPCACARSSPFKKSPSPFLLSFFFLT